MKTATVQQTVVISFKDWKVAVVRDSSSSSSIHLSWNSLKILLTTEENTVTITLLVL